MMSEKYKKKLENTMKWFPEYIEKTFSNKNMYHHLDRHINMSNAEMIHRASKESHDVSTFSGNEDDIVKMLHQELINSALEIAEYICDDEDDEPWEIFAELPGNVKGYGYMCNASHDWNNGPIECHFFSIIITKMKRENGFAVLSCYPVF